MFQRFQGTGLSLVTPFHRYGTIDFTSIEKIIDNALAKGVDFLVILSYCAEAASLSRDEKTAIRNVVADIVNRRVPVITGIKADNTQESINKIKSLDCNVVDAILVDCPIHHGKPKMKGIFNHFKQIATVSKVPVFLLNGNNRISVNLSVEVINDLIQYDSNIIGVIDSSDNCENGLDILSNKDGLIYISANDLYSYPLICMGADGCVSVAANAFPEIISKMLSHLKNRDFQEAKQIYTRMYPIIKLIYDEGKVSTIKALIEQVGLGPSNLRLPLVKIKKSILYQLQELCESLQQSKVMA